MCVEDDEVFLFISLQFEKFMAQDKRISDVCPLLHWVKRGQCQYTYLSLENIYYFVFNEEFLAEYVTLATDFD